MELLENLISWFLFECLYDGSVLEIGFFQDKLIIQNDTTGRVWVI